MGFQNFFKQEFGKDYSLEKDVVIDDLKESDDNDEDDIGLYDFSEDEFTKQDLIDFINELDDDEVNELGAYIFGDLMFDMEDEDEDEEDDLDESKINETKYFDKTKQQVRKEKHQNISDRKAKSREMKKLYKRNKVRILKKAKKYRRKVKRHPERVIKHRGS